MANFTDDELDILDELVEEAAISGDASFAELRIIYTIQEKLEAMRQ